MLVSQLDQALDFVTNRSHSRSHFFSLCLTYLSHKWKNTVVASSVPFINQIPFFNTWLIFPALGWCFFPFLTQFSLCSWSFISFVSDRNNGCTNQLRCPGEASQRERDEKWPVLLFFLPKTPQGDEQGNHWFPGIFQGQSVAGQGGMGGWFSSAAAAGLNKGSSRSIPWHPSAVQARLIPWSSRFVEQVCRKQHRCHLSPVARSRVAEAGAVAAPEDEWGGWQLPCLLRVLIP